ncbi:50S ribosomal protein L24 [Eubacteriales bacterium OttesenSCG-928-N13]|nr:50S ribosomal protein L24 [Eubacteriales bacterium OttesenSCG-928-N13]
MSEAKKKLFVHSGDTVVVITGKDKGKVGKIQKAFPQTGKIIVEGVAMVKRHQKPRGQGMPGGIINKESAIPACRVMLMCPTCKAGRRIGHKFLEDGSKVRKVRVCTKCGATFDN